MSTSLSGTPDVTGHWFSGLGVKHHRTAQDTAPIYTALYNTRQIRSVTNKEITQLQLREAFQKKTIESVSMLILPSDPPPPPPYCERLRLFFGGAFWITLVVWYAVKQIL